MNQLERFIHRLRWNSLRNSWSRLYWRIRSSYHVEPHPFMDGFDMDLWSKDVPNITINTGMPWGRLHPEHPHQFFGKDSVSIHYNSLVNNGQRIDLNIIENDDTVYHNGNRFVPELNAGCIYSEQEFLYGEFELECTLPKKGQWPSFWLLGDHSWPPEIDIFEFMPSELKVSINKRKLSTTIHYDDNHYQTGSAIRIPDQEGRAFYGLRWTPNNLEFFYNGISYLKLDDPKLLQKYFHRPMRIIVGTGVAGYDYDNNIFDSTFKVYNITYNKL